MFKLFQVYFPRFCFQACLSFLHEIFPSFSVIHSLFSWSYFLPHFSESFPTAIQWPDSLPLKAFQIPTYAVIQCHVTFQGGGWECYDAGVL